MSDLVAQDCIVGKYRSQQAARGLSFQLFLLGCIIAARGRAATAPSLAVEAAKGGGAGDNYSFKGNQK